MSENERDPIVEKWAAWLGSKRYETNHYAVEQAIAEARADERAKAQPLYGQCAWCGAAFWSPVAADRRAQTIEHAKTCQASPVVRERDELRAKLANIPTTRWRGNCVYCNWETDWCASREERDTLAREHAISCAANPKVTEIAELRAKLATVETDTRKRVAEECAHAVMRAYLRQPVIDKDGGIRAIRAACRICVTPPEPLPAGYPFEQPCRCWAFVFGEWRHHITENQYAFHTLTDNNCRYCGAARVKEGER